MTHLLVSISITLNPTLTLQNLVEWDVSGCRGWHGLHNVRAKRGRVHSSRDIGAERLVPVAQISGGCGNSTEVAESSHR